MSQKSNHYFSHGVISIIIKWMHDMKIIYFQYGKSQSCQEYEMDIKIWKITFPLHPFWWSLVAIACFWANKMARTTGEWVQKQSRMTERNLYLCLSHTYTQIQKGKLGTLFSSVANISDLLEIWDVISLALIYLYSLIVHPNQWQGLKGAILINRTPEKEEFYILYTN